MAALRPDQQPRVEQPRQEILRLPVVERPLSDEERLSKLALETLEEAAQREMAPRSFKAKAAEGIAKAWGAVVGIFTRKVSDAVKDKYVACKLAEYNVALWQQAYEANADKPTSQYFEDKLNQAKEVLHSKKEVMLSDPELNKILNSPDKRQKLEESTSKEYALGVLQLKNANHKTIDNFVKLSPASNNLLVDYQVAYKEREKWKNLVDQNQSSAFKPAYDQKLAQAIDNMIEAERRVKADPNYASYKDKHMDRISPSLLLKIQPMAEVRVRARLAQVSEEVGVLKRDEEAASRRYLDYRVQEYKCKHLARKCEEYKDSPFLGVYQKELREAQESLEVLKTTMKEMRFLQAAFAEPKDPVSIAILENLSVALPPQLNDRTRGIDAQYQAYKPQEEAVIRDYADRRQAFVELDYWGEKVAENQTSPFLPIYQQKFESAMARRDAMQRKLEANEFYQSALTAGNSEAINEALEHLTDAFASSKRTDLEVEGVKLGANEQAAKDKFLAWVVAAEEVRYLKTMDLDYSNTTKQFQIDLRQRVELATREMVECEMAVKSDPLLQAAMKEANTLEALKNEIAEPARQIFAEKKPQRENEIVEEKAKRVQELKESEDYRRAERLLAEARAAKPDKADKMSLADFLPPEYSAALSPEDLQKTEKTKALGKAVAEELREDRKVKLKPAAEMTQKQLREKMLQLEQLHAHKETLARVAEVNIGKGVENAQAEFEKYSAAAEKLAREIAELKPLIIVEAKPEEVKPELKTIELSPEEEQKRAKQKITELGQEINRLERVLEQLPLQMALIEGQMVSASNLDDDDPAKEPRRKELIATKAEIEKTTREAQAHMQELTAQRAELQAKLPPEPSTVDVAVFDELLGELTREKERKTTLEAELKRIDESTDLPALEVEYTEKRDRLLNETLNPTISPFEFSDLQRIVTALESKIKIPTTLPPSAPSSGAISPSSVGSKSPSPERPVSTSPVGPVAIEPAAIEPSAITVEEFNRQAQAYQQKYNDLEKGILTVDPDVMDSKPEVAKANDNLNVIAKEIQDLTGEYERLQILRNKLEGSDGLAELKDIDELIFDYSAKSHQIHQRFNEVGEKPSGSAVAGPRDPADVQRSFIDFIEKRFNQRYESYQKRMADLEKRFTLVLRTEEELLAAVEDFPQCKAEAEALRNEYRDLVANKSHILDRSNTFNDIQPDKYKASTLPPYIDLMTLDDEEVKARDNAIKSHPLYKGVEMLPQARADVLKILAAPKAPIPDTIDLPGIPPTSIQKYADLMVAHLRFEHAKDRLPDVWIEDEMETDPRFLQLDAARNALTAAERAVIEDEALKNLSDESFHKLNLFAHRSAYTRITEADPTMASYFRQKGAEKVAGLIQAKADFNAKDNALLTVDFDKSKEAADMYHESKREFINATGILANDVYYNVVIPRDHQNEAVRAEFEKLVQDEILKTIALKQGAKERAEIKGVKTVEELTTLKEQKLKEKARLTASRPTSPLIKQMDETIAYIDKRIDKIQNPPK